MKLNLNAAQLGNLKRYLESDPDCEQLGAVEYVADLYDVAEPVTLNLLFRDEEVDLAAAAQLLYDEAEDGWYMGEQIEDPEKVLALLAEAGAL